MKYLSMLFIVLIILFNVSDLDPKSSNELYVISEICADGMIFGYINRQGKVVIRPGWGRAAPFSKDGIAAVEGNYYPYPDDPPKECDCYKPPQGGGFSSGSFELKYKFIDKNGRLLFKNRYWSKTYGFSDGMVSVGKPGDFESPGMAFMNMQGRLVTGYDWQEPGAFYEGLAVVLHIDTKSQSLAYIDIKGNRIKGIPELKNIDQQKIINNGIVQYWNYQGYNHYYDKEGSLLFRLPLEMYAEEFRNGIAVLRKLKKNKINDWTFGYVNREGKILVPPEYDRVEPFSEGVGIAEKDKKFYLFDEEGKMLAGSLNYSYVYPFSEGLSQVSLLPGYSYIDKSGRLVFSKKFSQAWSFRDGIARVCTDGYNNCGFINKSGEFIIKPDFMHLEHFTDGLAVARLAGKGVKYFGYINRGGEFVIKPEYSSVTPFDNGLAQASINSKKFIINTRGERLVFPKKVIEFERNHYTMPSGYTKFINGYARVRFEDGWGFIDKNGRELTSEHFNTATAFEHGFAIVRYKSGEKWYSSYLGTEGKHLLNPRILGNYHPFYEGYALIEGAHLKEGVFDIIIDKRGSIVSKNKVTPHGPRFDYHGHGWYSLRQSSRWYQYYINKQGKMAIPFYYDWCSFFINGWALVSKDGVNMLIDKQGRVIKKINISLDYPDGMRPSPPKFEGNLIPYHEGNKHGFATLTGDIVIKARFDGVNMFSEGVALVQEGGSWGYIDKNGNYIFSPSSHLKQLGDFNDGMAVSFKDGKHCGYINKRGEYAVDPGLIDCTDFDRGLAWVCENKKVMGKNGYRCGYIDKSGRYVWRQTTWTGN